LLGGRSVHRSCGLDRTARQQRMAARQLQNIFGVPVLAAAVFLFAKNHADLI
jgi:hypothetical protein